MDEVSHPGVELDVSVLEAAVETLSLGDPALDLEGIAVLVGEMHIRSHEEAETRVLGKVLAELGGHIVRHAGLWLVVAGSPAELDERIVHKVRQLLQVMEQNGIVLV